MSDKCEFHSIALLTKYLAGELARDEEMRLDEHVKTCAACREACDAILDDPAMERLLAPLSAPDGLPGRIIGALPRQPSRTRTFARIAAIAAALIIGLAVGLVLPIGSQTTSNEAFASSLKNQITGFARNARFFNDEVRLLSASDPQRAASIMHSHLRMLSLLETGRQIVSELDSPQSERVFTAEEYRRIREFFLRAARTVGQFEQYGATGALSPQELATLASMSPNLIPAPDLVAPSYGYSLLPGQPPDTTDPAVAAYMEAKRRIFAGDFDSATRQLLSSWDSPSPFLHDVSGFWISWCYREVGEPQKASEYIDSMPKQYRKFLPMEEHRFSFDLSLTPADNSVSIFMFSGRDLNDCVSTHFYNDQDGRIVVGITSDGRVKLVENNTTTEFENMSAMRTARQDVFDKLFPGVLSDR
ncbi:MAG: zf-HC2 domain-containing protein [Candidatus Brocadiia bacterium]